MHRSNQATRCWVEPAPAQGRVDCQCHSTTIMRGIALQPRTANQSREDHATPHKSSVCEIRARMAAQPFLCRGAARGTVSAAHCWPAASAAVGVAGRNSRSSGRMHRVVFRSLTTSHRWHMRLLVCRPGLIAAWQIIDLADQRQRNAPIVLSDSAALSGYHRGRGHVQKTQRNRRTCIGQKCLKAPLFSLAQAHPWTATRQVQPALRAAASANGREPCPEGPTLVSSMHLE